MSRSVIETIHHEPTTDVSSSLHRSLVNLEKARACLEDAAKILKGRE